MWNMLVYIPKQAVFSSKKEEYAIIREQSYIKII
jgi:hypothetical protein